MLGLIAGDVIGSIYEGSGLKTKHFRLFGEGSTFTDDTVLAVAVAGWLLDGGDLVDRFHDAFHAFPQAGYGGNFIRWAAKRQRAPYNSWGNGSAMRVGPVGLAANSIDEALDLARQTAEVTHDHPEGIKGAQAVAAAVFLARTGRTKPEIAAFISSEFEYDLTPRLDDIRPRYAFDVSCQGSVPQSIIAFLESNDVEDAIRNAISLGGDADTMACIAGAIGEAFFGPLPDTLAQATRSALDPRLTLVVDAFLTRFGDRLSR